MGRTTPNQESNQVLSEYCNDREKSRQAAQVDVRARARVRVCVCVCVCVVREGGGVLTSFRTAKPVRRNCSGSFPETTQVRSVELCMAVTPHSTLFYSFAPCSEALNECACVGQCLLSGNEFAHYVRLQRKSARSQDTGTLAPDRGR